MTNPASTPPLFEVRQLSKRFRVGGWFKPTYVHALRDVSFTIDRREIVALVGESGSGKSTIARTCVRLEEPSQGQIFLDGRDVLQDERQRASRGYRQRVQMIFQDPFGSLNPVRSVSEHLARPITLHHGPFNQDELRDRVSQLLDAVGLSPARDFLNKRPGELSGGQRQRVAIARALAPKPDLIFADEPVSMLDLSIRADILNLMLDLKESRDVAFVYITHDLASARYIADRTMVLYAGRVMESGQTEDVLRNPLHPYTKLLVAAVPDMAESRLRELPVRSSTTNPSPPVMGCPFAPRCPEVLDRCTRQTVPEVHIDTQRIVHCHLPTQSTTKKPAAKDQ